MDVRLEVQYSGDVALPMVAVVEVQQHGHHGYHQ